MCAFPEGWFPRYILSFFLIVGVTLEVQQPYCDIVSEKSEGGKGHRDGEPAGLHNSSKTPLVLAGFSEIYASSYS